MKRTVESDIIEQWMTHLRLQRTRARDMVWLIEHGATLHDGRDGVPMNDATPSARRWPRPMPGSLSQINRRGTRPSWRISSHDPNNRSSVLRVGII